MIELEELLQLELTSRVARENKYRQMFKKCTSMNLLASYSISIQDLLDIMGSNKDDEGLEEMTELIKKSDENEEGYIDFEEFKGFMDMVFFYKQTIMLRSANALKKIVLMQWGPEKKSKIDEHFEQICKVNIVSEKP